MSSPGRQRWAACLGLQLKAIRHVTEGMQQFAWRLRLLPYGSSSPKSHKSEVALGSARFDVCRRTV